MINRQFQHEPVGMDSVTTLSAPDRTEASRPAGISNAAVASLLLGLSLRGRLTDSEKEFLDNLAPVGSITFLVRNGHYLHPEDVTLFPLEVIEDAVNQGGEALFSHCHRPSAGDTAHTRCIHTAVVNPGQPNPLVIGLFGPEDEPGGHVLVERFDKLVSCFRNAHRSLAALAERTKASLDSRTPTLIINRASGRVIALNRSAANLLEDDKGQLIDLEFNHLRKNLPMALSNRRLTMQNLSEGDLNLSVVTFPSAAVQMADDPFVADFFVYRFRHKISNIMIASTLLESVAGTGLGRDESAMVRTIIGEAQELDDYVTKANLLLDYDRLASGPTNLITELEHAVDLVTNSLGSRCYVEIRGRACNLNLDAPRSAFVSLFEAVLLAHLIDQEVSSRTTVVLDNAGDNGGISITFDTVASQAPKLRKVDSCWSDYVQRLSSRMGISSIDSQPIEGRNIRTELAIKTRQSTMTE